MRKIVTVSLLSLISTFFIGNAFGQNAKDIKKAEKNSMVDTENEDVSQNTDTISTKRAVQRTGPVVTIGIEAGLNVSYMEYFLFSNDIKAGGRAGIVADFKLSDKVYIQPVIFYAMNGATGKESFRVTDNAQILYLNTVEVPFVLLLKLGSRQQFLLGGGGFIADNISGHAQSNVKIGSADNDDIKAIDYGAKICIGHQSLSGFFFKAGVQKGLANLNPNKYDNKLTTTCITVDFGFMFGENKKHHHRKSNNSSDALEMKM